MMKVNTNWYREEHGNKHSAIIATSTISHTCIYVTTIKDVVDLPHSLCNKKQAQRSVKRHPIFISDKYHD